MTLDRDVMYGDYGHAKVIAASRYEGGPTVYTVQATCRRFVLAELNTHRVLSKNSASSRAIPFVKQVERVMNDLAYPEVFPAEQKGMQGGDELSEEDVAAARDIWEASSHAAVNAASDLARLGVHKSVVNRILEPYMWHTVVLTGTAWENFLAQRVSPLAQPEIRVMAEAIQTAIQNAEVETLEQGGWHLPYAADDPTAAEWASDQLEHWDEEQYYVLLAKISAARCARVSYLTQEGTRDPAADIELYNRLVTARPAHWSPLEHVATPWPDNRQVGGLVFPSADPEIADVMVDLEHLPRVGNLLGWRSLRTTVEARLGEVTYR